MAAHLDHHLDTNGGPQVDPDGTHWRRLLANLANEPPRPVANAPVVRGWVTWTRPVQAGCYSDLDALDTLHAWVRQLHEHGRLSAAVQFGLEDDAGVPVGVLFDPNETLGRWAVLRRGSYLVFTGDQLVVLDEKTFHTTYCDPAYTYSQSAGQRRAG